MSADHVFRLVLGEFIFGYDISMISTGSSCECGDIP